MNSEQSNDLAGMSSSRPVIGVLPGEGVGPEVIGSAIRVLEAVQAATGRSLEVFSQGSADSNGADPSAAVIEFCEATFARRGPVLAGPYGGRVVYDLRRHFDLYCKLNPLMPSPELKGAARLRPEHLHGVDIMVVREGTEGVYQGGWQEMLSDSGERRAGHWFSYSEAAARRILQRAAEIAQKRTGRLAVVVKRSGVPTISQLWSDVAQKVAAEAGIECTIMDVDYAAYFLVQHPDQLDVLVAPNLFGDILSDIGGVLLGSRALSFSGNFSDNGASIFQTNHGAAHDLAGEDRANPSGQILATAMLLRSGLGLEREASMVESALAKVWSQGWRTFDIAEPGCRILGTREFGVRVAGAVEALG
jgi:3-isopropylmalate dehydrogenase